MARGSPGRRMRILAASAFGVAFALVLALACLETACLKPAPKAAVERLSIAVPSVPHAALLHIAVERGYFAQEGLEVAIVPVVHGKAALELVVARKADIAAVADVPFVLSVLKGEALGIVARIVSVSNDNAIVARRDRGIGAPRDLAGKRIGVTLGTSGEYFVWSFLAWNRIAPASVRMVDLSPGVIAGELGAGIVDAVATWPPIVSEAQAALGENAVSFGEANAYRLSFVVAGREDFLKGHPQAVERLVRALVKADEFNAAQPAQALRIVAARLNVDEATLRRAWREFQVKVDLAQSQLTTMEEQARWASARGYAATGELHNFLPHLYPDALLAVKPERVTVVR